MQIHEHIIDTVSHVCVIAQYAVLQANAKVNGISLNT